MTKDTSPFLTGATWDEDEDDLEDADIFEEAEIVEDDLIVEDGIDEALSVASLSESSPSLVRSPLSTVTLAEIYFAQGFHEQALQIYEDLFMEDPCNMDLLRRINEIDELLHPQALLSPPVVSKPPVLTPTVDNARKDQDERVLATFEQMLENIQTIRTKAD